MKNIINADFEKISKYENDESVTLPTRKTQDSAGYDFIAAEDTVIPSYQDQILEHFTLQIAQKAQAEFETSEAWEASLPYTLEQIAALTKMFGTKMPLVPTGIKCKMPEGYYLQLSVRSSLPYKHWLMMGNGVGIIDSDYYNNPDNEGNIYFQIINLLPVPIVIQKGECFGQGILMPYCITNGDQAEGQRLGGLGSTT